MHTYQPAHYKQDRTNEMVHKCVHVFLYSHLNECKP